MSTIHTREAGEPATLDAIRKVEQRFGFILPDAYREFLRVNNGGRPDRDMVKVPGCKESPEARIHFFFGVEYGECYDLAWNVEVLQDRLPADVIAIATTEGADQIGLNLTTGGVVFWDGWYHTIYPLADSFEAFIDSLYVEEEPPAEGEPSGAG